VKHKTDDYTNFQAAQLWLVNPRDSRQSHITITTFRLWVICHPVARIDLAYTCVQNLTTLGSTVPVIWLEPPKYLMGHMTWPRPRRGQFVVHGLGLAMINMHTKFEVSSW